MPKLLKSKIAWVALIILAGGALLVLGSRRSGPESFWRQKYHAVRQTLWDPAANEWYRTVYVRLGRSPEHGQKLYGELCSHCHQERGRGSNLNVAVLPRAGSDEALADIIRHGIPGTDIARHAAEGHRGVAVGGIHSQAGEGGTGGEDRRRYR
jgi:cytochrome c5